MALHPQNVEWQRPVEPQMWNPVQVKLLALDCRLMKTRCRLLLSWPWLKWRGLCSTRCVEVCGVVLLQTHNFWASNSRIWGTLQLTRLFCNLKGLCDMKMEKIRGLNMNLNVGWHFHKLAWIRKLVRKLPIFATWFTGCETWNWTYEMAHVCLEVLSQAPKIFTSWIVDLWIWALRISQVGPYFHKLEFQLAKFSQIEILLCISGFFSFFGSLRLSSNSFEVPPNFDHPKSLS